MSNPKAEEQALRAEAEKVTAEGLTTWGGSVTPSQASALFRAVKDVAVGYSGGVTKIEIKHGPRRKILVEVYACSKGFAPELAWVGHVGVRGATHGRSV